MHLQHKCSAHDIMVGIEDVAMLHLLKKLGKLVEVQAEGLHQPHLPEKV